MEIQWYQIKFMKILILQSIIYKFQIIMNINLKWDNYYDKSILILSLINLYIILCSIWIEKKHSHKYKIVAISYANNKYLKQLKIKLIDRKIKLINELINIGNKKISRNERYLK